jgi:hypothetical protein
MPGDDGPPNWDDPNFCAYHMAVEEPGTIRCGECWHQWPDEAAVERDVLELWGDTMTWDQIFSCPWCSHDF